jgi:hypothetical protein
VAKFRVTNEPVSSGDTVVVMDDDGKLAAFRADPAHASPAVPDPPQPPTKAERKAAKAAAKAAAKKAAAAPPPPPPNH